MIRAYICCSLRKENYSYVDDILRNQIGPELPEVVFLRPHPDELSNPIKKYDTVEADVAMIKASDELWVMGYFGNDCCVEIGMALMLGKRVRVLKDKTNAKVLDNSWMIFHGIPLNLLRIHHSLEDFMDDVASTIGD